MFIQMESMNRLLILLAFVVLFEGTAFSDCMPMQFSAWPGKDTIARNPLIILSFPERRYPRSFLRNSGTSSVAKDVRFFLDSGSEKIPLKLIQQNSGQSKEKQLIFKPARLLKPDTKYTLSFVCKDSLLREKFLDIMDVGFKPRTWITNRKIDMENPVWLSKPAFSYQNYVHYGCGPESYWRFCTHFKDESEVHIQTIVRHLESGTVSEFYLYPDSNSVFVGYGMCGGEFDMIPGERYSVSFNLVDASGNSDNRFSDPIFVQAPTEYDYLSEEELEKKTCPCVSKEKKGASIDFIWILGILSFIVTIAFANWYRNTLYGNVK